MIQVQTELSVADNTGARVVECIKVCNPDVIMHTNSTYPCPVEELNLNYINWLKGGWGKKPMVFYLTTSGDDGIGWYCAEHDCQSPSYSQDISICERETGKECKLFGRRNQIVWKKTFKP